MLSHRNIMANIRGAWGLLERSGSGDDVFLSFLPLCHAYEHTAGQFLPIAMGARDLLRRRRRDALQPTCVEARPTILPCVPRLYEVLRQRSSPGVERQGGLQAAAVPPGAGAGPPPLPRRPACRRISASSDLLLDRLVRAQGARALRRPAQGHGLGRRAAQPRCRPVLPRAGAAGAAGLRPDRGRTR